MIDITAAIAGGYASYPTEGGNQEREDARTRLEWLRDAAVASRMSRDASVIPEIVEQLAIEARNAINRDDPETQLRIASDVAERLLDLPLDAVCTPSSINQLHEIHQRLLDRIGQ